MGDEGDLAESARVVAESPTGWKGHADPGGLKRQQRGVRHVEDKETKRLREKETKRKREKEKKRKRD